MSARDDRKPVVVLDFGAQYAQLIARRVRGAGVYAEVHPGDTPFSHIKRNNPAAIVLSGGPGSVYEMGAPTCDAKLFTLDVPILGICYGHQLMAWMLGGEVARTGQREYGRTQLTIQKQDETQLLSGIPEHSSVWMSHTDSVTRPPNGFETVAVTDGSPVAAMENIRDIRWGVQFHPEVSHTEYGQKILERFLFDLAGLQQNWRSDHLINELVSETKEAIGDSQVVCAFSGGVDSAVAAALVQRAVGDQLTCVFVDHGLLRQGEADEVVETFRNLGTNIHVVNASDQFLTALEGKSDPEEKRTIVGNTFINVFEEACQSIGSIDYLVQGTIYSDWIESGGSENASTIKSHHNVGGLPERMRLDLVEPLKYLFKDEVRRIGSALGLPDDIVWRQPFPGPGLAVRIRGAVTPERLELLRRADAIVREEIESAETDEAVWQAFAVLPDAQSVGVQGDNRTYGEAVVVRVVSSNDAMTADWVRLPHETLERISTRITNEVESVNRVLLDITSKPPATIEWE